MYADSWSLNIKKRVKELWRFLRYLFRQFRQNKGTLNAAALTYTTLFAVVPLMTVSYAMLSAIPSFQGVELQLENLIFNHFVPTSGAAVKNYLGEFASQARTLTAVGVGFLIVTAYMMLKTIEAAFNHIWRVEQPRRGVSSFLLYWAVLSLGPLLLGLGFALTSYLVSLPLFTDASELIGGDGQLLKLLPVLFSTVAFTFIYVAVPNCPVILSHGFVGGLCVALVFEAAKQSFTLFVSHFPSYELIYGAFAAVPLFLAWVYISWLIILLGAELVRAISTYSSATTEVSDEQHLGWVLLILEDLWEAQRGGGSVSEEDLLEKHSNLDPGHCCNYLNYLLDGAVVTRTEQGNYLLSRDLHLFNLRSLCDLMPWKLPESLSITFERPWLSTVDRCLRDVSSYQSQQLAIDLASLFGEQSQSHDPGAGIAELRKI
ncbi:YihY family inner membrane protein [Motiliproteus sp. MSK22-1]|uniref:YihY family inner membrane protein n=1 Tax=Motiliproteus sp. MSK22-1 TaxID=1897630 RepID=UPI0009774FCF|nr:YihY family inner membrane protein [Motiliproteus sp. MSK22-1]OMH25889.1 hypothetical protein BGP75_25600 [Motiliproteus sp. MSK22-1]